MMQEHKTNKEEIKEELMPSNDHRSSHIEDMVDHYWFSINYVASLIKSSELKAGLILSFYGILLNFAYQNIEIFNGDVAYPFISNALLTLWIICIIVSIFYSVRCFIPRIEDKFESNIFFFKDVISKYGDAKAFSKTFYDISINEEKVFQQLGQQVFVNSKIADWKFKNVNKSIRLLAVGLAILLLIIIFKMLTKNI